MSEHGRKLISGAKQAFCILVLSLLLAVAYNQLSPNRLSWSSWQASPVTGDSMEITLEEARDLQVKGKAVFLDARDSASFRERHITGALNISTDMVPANLEFLQTLSKSGKILIAYCDGIGCPLGGEVARNLRQQGLGGVRVLAKGLSFWAEAKYPVDK